MEDLTIQHDWFGMGGKTETDENLPESIVGGEEALKKCPEEIEKKMKQWVKENKASIEHCPAFQEWMKKEDLSNMSFVSLENYLREQVEGEGVSVDERDVLLGRLKRIETQLNKAIDMAEELAQPEKSEEEKADVVASGKFKTYNDVLELINDLYAAKEEAVKRKEIINNMDIDEEKIDEALEHLEENKKVFCPEEGLYQV